MYLGYEETITVFLELKCGRREGKDGFPPFLCSPTLHLNFKLWDNSSLSIMSPPVALQRQAEDKNMRYYGFIFSEHHKKPSLRWNEVQQKVRAPGFQEEICPEYSTDCSISHFSLWTSGDPTISLLNSQNENV